MPGMGLLRRRCTDVAEPSEEALDALDDLNAAMRRVDGSGPGAAQSRQEPSNALLEALQGTMAQVQQALVSEDALGAFRLLEAVVMFIEQEENLVSGLPESACSSLMRLTFAGIITAARHLLAAGQLESQTIPNYKYVISRAVGCGEHFSGLCSAEQEEEADILQGPQVLQALLDGSEDELQGCEGNSSLDFEAQWEQYRAQVGSVPANAYEDAQQQLLAELPPNAELSGDDDDVGALGEQGMAHDQLEEALKLQELLTRRLPPAGQAEEDALGDADPDDAQEGGVARQQQAQQGRLAALDDPVLRPMLLRTVQRLEEGHAVRLEVEQEIGGIVGSAAYTDALLEAEANAAAAGATAPQQQQAGSDAAGVSNSGAATGGNVRHALPPALVPFGLGALNEFSMEGALPSPAADDDGTAFLQLTNSALRSIDGSGSIRGMLGSEATSASSAAAAAAAATAAAGLMGAAGGNAVLDGSSSVMLYNSTVTDGSALQGASQSLLLPLHSATPAVGSAGNGMPTGSLRGEPSLAPLAQGPVGEPSLGAFSSASFAFMNSAGNDLAEDSVAQLMGGGRSTDGTDWLRQPFNSAAGSDGRADSIGGLVGSALGGGGDGEFDSDNWFASEGGDGGGEAGLWAGSLDALEASVDASGSGGGNTPGSSSLMLGKRPPGVMVGGAVPRRPSKLSRVS